MYRLLEIGEDILPGDEVWREDRTWYKMSMQGFKVNSAWAPVRRKVDGVIVDREKWQKVIDTVQWWYDLADKNA